MLTTVVIPNRQRARKVLSLWLAVALATVPICAASARAVAANVTPTRPARAPVPGLRVDANHQFDTIPAYIGSTACLLTTPPGSHQVDAVRIVKEFAERRRDLLNDVAGALDGARLTRDFVTRHNGVRHLTFQQTYNGLDVVGARLRASLTREGGIISLGGVLVSPPPAEGGLLPFTRSPQQASRLVLTAAGPGSVLQVQPVYYPLSDTHVTPAWKIVYNAPPDSSTYESVIDDRTGSTLRRHLRTRRAASEDISLRVYPGDSPAPGSPGTAAPDGFQFPLVSSELRTLTPAELAGASPEGWIADGDNETRGNNVDAYADVNSDDQPDLPRLEGYPYRVFDYASSPTQEDPASYRNASVVQLFYLCNIYHDRLYQLGFDEAAHNFQWNNFGLGGVGGDPVMAETQDTGLIDCARFTTGPDDGSPARLEMHLFTGPSPVRDSAFDADLVFHELSHGLSTRLLGGLSGIQPDALAEGWSDFVALALNAAPEDDPQGTYPFGAFVSYQRWPGYVDNYYFGLRRFPYSTDHNKSPQTYADIDPAQQSFPADVPRNTHVDNTADTPHNAGEVWCNALLQCRANLMSRHGFAGHVLMLQLVIDGMKLAVVNPNMIQARDAILQADLVNNGGANQDLLWEGFASRGLGFSASSPPSGTSGIVEGFDVPFAVQFVYPSGLPEFLPADHGAIIPVEVYGLAGATPTPHTGTLTFAVDGEAPQTVDMVATGPHGYHAHLPPAACSSVYHYHFSVQEPTLGIVTDPPDAPETMFEATSGTGELPAMLDDLETDTGWTVGADDDDATGGIWSRMDPEGTIAQPEDDHTPAPGALCWVTDGRSGTSDGSFDVDGGKTTLYSPPFALEGENALVSYWRWFSNDEGASPNEDTFVVSISNDDGAEWHLVEELDPAGPEASGGWFYNEFPVADVVPASSQMLLRFVAQDLGSPSLVEAAIDDFSVVEFDCTALSPGDFDDDGDVDLDDHAALVDCLAGPGAPPAPTLPPAATNCLHAFDLDSDADVDLGDAALFAIVLSAS